MVRRVVSRSFVVVLTAAALGLVSASPAAAYGGGPANWQIGFSGTATLAGVGGFGFWGWCAFAGGVTSGNSGDCQVTQYFHQTRVGGVNCNQSLDVTSWDGSGGTFVISGTAATNPASAAGSCGLAGGLPPTFGGFNTGLPAAPGHFSIPASFLIPGAEGSIQIQATLIPQ